MYKNLDNKKSTSGNIPTKMLKLASGYALRPLTNCINKCISTQIFAEELKLADIIPVFKKGDSTSKENYPPISLLPLISKIFEQILFEQMTQFAENVFSPKLCGFRKGYSTQYALAHLLRYWQHTLDNSKIVGTVLMDLSKAYDCLPHSFLIAKLAAYGFDLNSLELISSYLSNRYQRVKINSKFSNYLKVPQGVPQGSILGPLLFNFFINDLFNCIEISEVCNFADDTTIYTEGNNLEIAKTKLELETNNVLNWFKINSMVANPAKFQIMFLGQGITNKELNFKIDNITLSCSTEVKLLGIFIDEKLNFEKHQQPMFYSK